MTLIKNIEDLGPVKKKIVVNLPAKRVSEALDEAYAKISKKAKIKGFRQGKIPRNVLEQYYKPEAEKQAVETLVDKSYPESIQESKLFPVSYPEIKVNSFDGKGMTYEATFEIRPTVDVKGFKGLKLTQPKVKVEEKEITERLGYVRERMAQMIPVGKKRGLKKGDIVTLTYSGLEGKRNFTNGTVKDYTAEIGKGALLADFEKAILGLKTGGKKKVSLTLPSNFQDKSLAGKKVIYDVEVTSVKEKRLPKLDDDFAKDLGQFKTLAELKKKVKEDIAKEQENGNRAALREQIVDQLVKKNKFDVPQGMVAMELEGMWKNFLNYLQQQGVTPEKAGIKPEEFAEKNKESAIKRVQTFVLFDDLVKKGDLKVSDADVDKKIEETAEQTNQSPVVLKQQYKSKNLYPQLKESLLAEKTLDFVLEAATIKVK